MRLHGRMYNKSSMKWLLLTVVLAMVQCEDWFMPDSRLISDVQFRQVIKADSYKLVKFFTPNCVYCRYLKNVIDKLKHQNQWGFAIYDLNCNWYPRLCQELRIGSFPYTAIYDQNGQLDNSINGFYPEPVIREIFDKIQAEVVRLAQEALKKANGSLQSEQPTSQEVPKEENNEVFAPSHDVQEEKHQIQQESEQTARENQQMKEQIKGIKKNSKQEIQKESLQNDHASQTQPSSLQTADKPERDSASIEKHSEGLPGIYQHIFFAFIILLGVIYFSSFMGLIKPTHQRINPESHFHSKDSRH